MKKRILWRDIILNDTVRKSVIPPEKVSQEMLSAIKELKAKYYTPEGTVDYKAIRVSNEYREYKQIAANLRDFSLDLFKDEKEKLAFWINLYNTIVVEGIIELGIESSVKEVIGFFSKIKYLIAKQKFSPNDIEHGILRGNKRPPYSPFRQFGTFNQRRKYALPTVDARIHFALVCGSRSCAPIKFYTSENIYKELELASQSFVNSQGVNIIPEDKRIQISTIFKWYQADFGGINGVLDFISRYIFDDAKRDFLTKNRDYIKVDYLPYDWSLNA